MQQVEEANLAVIIVFKVIFDGSPGFTSKKITLRCLMSACCRLFLGI
jgi:hypothetical protein